MSGFRAYATAVAVHYSGTLLSILASLLLTRQAYQQLGAERIGEWFMLLQLTGFLPLLELGAFALCAREVATGMGTGDRSRALGAARARRRQALLLWPALIACSAGVLLVVSRSRPDLLPAFATILVANALAYPLRYAVSVLQGLQDLTFLGVATLASTLLGIAAGIGLLHLGWAIEALAASWAIQQLLGLAVSTLRVTVRHGPEWLVGGPPGPRAPGFWSRGAAVSGSSLLHTLMNGSDALMVGSLLGSGSATALAATSRLPGIAGMLGSTMTQVAVPRVARAHGEDPREGASREALRLAFLAMSVTGALAVGIGAVNGVFVSLWLREEVYAGAAVSAAVLLHLVLRQGLTSLGVGLLGRAMDHISLATAALEVALFLALVPLALRWSGSVLALPLVQCLLGTGLLLLRLRLLTPEGGWGPGASRLVLLSFSTAAMVSASVGLPGLVFSRGRGWGELAALALLSCALVGVQVLLTRALLRSCPEGRSLLTDLGGLRTSSLTRRARV